LAQSGSQIWSIAAGLLGCFGAAQATTSAIAAIHLDDTLPFVTKERT
jgi:hypothetical protein